MMILVVVIVVVVVVVVVLMYTMKATSGNGQAWNSPSPREQ